jgi:putative serine protease PepD
VLTKDGAACLAERVTWAGLTAAETPSLLDPWSPGRQTTVQERPRNTAAGFFARWTLEPAEPGKEISYAVVLSIAGFSGLCDNCIRWGVCSPSPGRVSMAGNPEYGTDVNEPKQSRRPRRWLLWAALGTALVAGGVAGGLIVGATQSSGSTVNSPSSTGSATLSACPVTSVADRVIPSVVTIAASGPGGGGTGSGEVIRPDGYILTNNHVISVAAASGGSVEVLFSDGQTVPAVITGRDPQTDLAVLKVETSRELKVISLGSSSVVKVGQPVVAIGAPLGLSGTVTSGIVSALDRTVQVPGDGDSNALLVSALQTDAAINPGNSGGALVNCEGQLVGVPTAGATVPNSGGGSIGLGFAIPVDLAKSIADEIIATGRVTHAFFGLQTVPIPPAAAEQAGLPVGLYIRGVTPGGPAAMAGLRPDDVITKIDGEPATSNLQLEVLTLTKRPGDTVAITYTRDGRSATASVTLAAQP